MQPLITLTSDFGKQTQGVGQMEAVIFKINPAARVIHLMHGLPAYDLFSAARTMETIANVSVGYHVCVVDPGVGTARKGIVVQTKRGDYLIGPDNGCLMAAPRVLGGIVKAVELKNEKYMNLPVSPIFHGRDVFSAAAHLSLGVAVEEFGEEINEKDLVAAPYGVANVEDGGIAATVIHVNDCGSLVLNISHEEWDKLGLEIGSSVSLQFSGREVNVQCVKTFGEVVKGEPVILKDDYTSVEIALNQASFVEKYPAKVGDKVVVKLR
jgi:S-adenosyl-L-methionine hydrolase (adenosine-forming)